MHHTTRQEGASHLVCVVNVTVSWMHLLLSFSFFASPETCQQHGKVGCLQWAHSSAYLALS